MPPTKCSDSRHGRVLRNPASRILFVTAGVVLLSTAISIVYQRTSHAPFFGDDAPSVVENDSIRRLWPPWTVDGEPGPLSRFRSSPVAARPLVNLSLALNYRFGKLDPAGYRRINLGLHVAVALLLWAVITRTLRLPYFCGNFDQVALRIGFLIALVWAMHPLVTEAVAYVTQRTELMVSACYLAVLYCSLRYVQAATRRQHALWGLAATFACWAGAASKEIMVTAPVMVLLFDRTFFNVSIRDALRRSGPLYVGLFSSWMLTIILQGGAPHSDSAGLGTGVSPTDWWFTQSKVLLMYLRLVVWPWPLSIHYEPPYLTSFGAAWLYVLPVAVLVIGSLVLLWRRSAVGYVAAFALAILAPTLIVPIATEIAAERRMYLPLAAILVLVVAGGYRVLCHVMSSRAAIWATGIVACLLAVAGGIVSSVRLADYRDEETLWTKVMEHDPTNATARYNVGTMYLERGQPREAAELFKRAIEVRPDHAKAHHNLGAAYSALGLRDEATREFEIAVELEPRYGLGYAKLGLTALKAGNVAEARRQFDAALRVAPNDSAAHSGMASLLLETGKLDDAIRHAQRAIDSDPNDANAQNVLGAALARQQRFTEAIPHFESAVRLDPSMMQAQGNLMGAYASVGRARESLDMAHQILAAARAAGDTAMVEQVEAFLAAYQSGDTSSGMPNAPHD